MMALSIYKYEIFWRREPAIIHRGAELLYADSVEGRYFVWARVDPARERVGRQVGLFLTGDEVPTNWEHVDSFRVPDSDGSPFLGHVFDGGEF